MNVIKLSKKTPTKSDQVQLLVSLYCLLSDIKLSNIETKILSYFVLYKINDVTKDLIFKSGLISAEQSYNNIISKFKKLNFIKKDEIKREYYINVDVLKAIEPTTGVIIKSENLEDDTTVGVMLKIDNS